MNKQIRLLSLILFQQTIFAQNNIHPYYEQEAPAEPLQGISMTLSQDLNLQCPMAGANNTIYYKEQPWAAGTAIAFNVKDKDLYCTNADYPIRVHMIINNQLNKTCCLSSTTAHAIYQNQFANIPQPPPPPQETYLPAQAIAPRAQQVGAPSIRQYLQNLRSNISQAGERLRQWNQHQTNSNIAPTIQPIVYQNPPQAPAPINLGNDNFTAIEYRYPTPRLNEIAERLSLQKWESYKNKKGEIIRRPTGTKKREDSDKHCFMYYKMQMQELDSVQCWSEDLDTTLNANQAHQPLINLGYRVIGKEWPTQSGHTPQSAPYASVIVWNKCAKEDNTPKRKKITDPGHIETKLSIGFASDFIAPLNSRSGCSGYTIYFKEDCVL